MLGNAACICQYPHARLHAIQLCVCSCTFDLSAQACVYDLVYIVRPVCVRSYVPPSAAITNALTAFLVPSFLTADRGPAISPRIDYL